MSCTKLFLCLLTTPLWMFPVTVSPASALTCSECVYAVVKKGDNSGVEDVQDTLDGYTLKREGPHAQGPTIGIDEECKKNGDDYTSTTNETCLASVTHCQKMHFFVKFTKLTVECELEFFIRQCVEADRTVSTGCDKNSSYYQGDFPQLFGVTRGEISGDFCYCSSDLCNAASAVTVSTLAVLLAIIATAVFN